MYLTFFTLWGFFSLRHLRMSISVVLTQPGCGGWGVGGRTGCSDSSSRLSLFKIHSVPAPHICSVMSFFVVTHHRPMDVPECPLLAVQNLPLCLVLLPVNPTISRKKPQREHVWQISGMRHRHANTADKEDGAARGAGFNPSALSSPGLG